jgi:hypothetical protein
VNFVRAEKSNAERCSTHFSAFNLSALSRILFFRDVIGYHPVRIPACSRTLSECDTFGCGANEVLHPEGDASHMHVSAILSGWEE